MSENIFDELVKKYESLSDEMKKEFDRMRAGLKLSYGKGTMTAEKDMKPRKYYAPEAKKADRSEPVESAEQSEPDCDEDFWRMERPKERRYEAPKFEGHTIDVTEIVDSAAEHAGEISRNAEKAADRAISYTAEKIAPRDSHSGGTYFPNSAFSPRTDTRRYHTSSYKPRPKPTGATFNPPGRNSGAVVAVHENGGELIKKITVRSWGGESEFYGRFTADAEHSHNASPAVPYTEQMERVDFASYVPQYSHMNRRQIEFYRWVRENIRHGRYPDCDIAYLQLYICELINLPATRDEAAERIVRLADLWLGYRERYPRLDGFLCEWLADYSMIHGVIYPKSLYYILHIIIPKAQMKEFYLDPALTQLMAEAEPKRTHVVSLGRMILEISSDYDYKSSRYYKGNEAAYDEHIPYAAAMSVMDSLRRHLGAFSMERMYKITRDTYMGAVVSSGVKKRLELEFLSFTRRADTREAVTSVAKYCENCLRRVLGIKSKLTAAECDSYDRSVIDRIFAPMNPTVEKVEKGDEFMPRDYLKNYEAESAGFDFMRAQEIEYASWSNTERLTEDASADIEEEDETLNIRLDGEMGCDGYYDDPPNYGVVDLPEEEPSDTAEDEGEVLSAIRAALAGEFDKYCRDSGSFPGEVADRVNNYALDRLGDILLEAHGRGYKLIEEYRKDAETWL